MPRFVVLLHEMPANNARSTHFDLMLEGDGVLRTWALERLPAGGEAVAAERLADHRLDYLDYEGDIAGDRGRVSRVDAGEYDLTADSESAIDVGIRGQKLCGTLRLTRDAAEIHLWRVSLSPD